MSDYIQYTQWRQREEQLARELEQHRSIAERLAADEVEASALADARVGTPQPEAPQPETKLPETKLAGENVDQEPPARQDALQEQELVSHG